ncbi:putative 8-amino-7-oxononanoate synthase [Aliidongia dinghuensis]|uniref:8-amino-7-oxononanoate synthase n=1 Tax=Aliidongia dinghuensis TaxID=1867774 RepID=A0A8J3E3S3_9PROT|nr:8-amino-7-oxononanoate synthase [Aliidongia dinghuensis]GGF21202.1 putative 8-amino-7-oxononanoate synthase [Aliidongia dinghuensis]
MTSLDQFAAQKLAELDAKSLRRSLRETRRDGAVHAWRDGRRVLAFCDNDYLNLSQDERVKRAAIAAIETHGTGSGASRLVTGNHPLYAALEARLAALKGTEDAIVFGSGYLANIGIVPALVGPGDLILADALAHACLNAGARLSGAKVVLFRHNDLAHLTDLLASLRGAHRHCMILIDRVYSMDGDLAPVAEISALADQYDAWLMTDDAHGIGVLPKEDPALVPLQMGTLSKALGSYGGYLCAKAPIVDLLRSRARSFVYTTGLPPASVAAALAALDVIEGDPEWARTPVERARQFTRLLNLPNAESPIVPVVIGEADAALAASERLLEQGFLVTAIRPPTVPDGTARLRITFSAGHSEADVAALAEAVRAVLP